MIIFILILIYLLPIILSIIFMIINYKLCDEDKDKVTIGRIYNYYYNSDSFTEIDNITRIKVHYLTVMLFIPLANIGIMLYFLVSIIYNSIKNIEI